MLKNYLKITFRNMIRQKTYSFINIAGLAVGMACFILISMWVQDELSFDRFHEKIDQLYRVTDYEKYSNGEEVYFSQNAAPLGPILKDKYPEIHEFNRCRRRGGIVSYGSKKFNQDGFIFTDPSFFDLFSFEIVRGNKETLLAEPHSIVITEEMAEKYFAVEDPIGKTLRIDNRLDFQVSGIVKNPPANSHIQFKMLLPFTTIKEFGANIDSWRSWAYATYVLLDKNADFRIVSDKITNIIKENEDDAIATVSLQPVKDIHLHANHIWGFGGDGDIKYVYIFSAIAVFLLLTACINFMNLSTARAAKRAKEVGLRKVVGAGKRELVIQFLNESMLMTTAALLFALSLVNLALPFFNTLSGKDLAFSLTGNFELILIILGTVIFTGLISGSYPAFFLSRYKPAKVLKGSILSGLKGSGFRRILVSFQFILTIALIFGTLVINRQIDFIKNQKLGFNKEHVLTIDLPGELGESTEYLRTELSKNPDVLNITAGSGQPNRLAMSRIFRDWEGRQGEEQFLGFLLYSDENYAETFEMEMLEGRYFSKEFTTDTGAVVINQAAAKIMGMENPLGKTIDDYKIIGVLKDFHFRSLRSKIGPLIVYYGGEDFSYNQLLVKLRAGNISENLASFTDTWAAAVPEFPLEYQFVDDYTERMYRTDLRVEKVINTFTVLILFIACLGLFGLAAFTAEQRTKEIGVRKVLGAKVSGIILLLCKEFIKWVIVAALFAWPIGWYVMEKWLQTFAYRVDLGIGLLLLSGAAAMIIALVTVSSQALKAAVSNPIDALRYE